MVEERNCGRTDKGSDVLIQACVDSENKCLDVDRETGRGSVDKGLYTKFTHIIMDGQYEPVFIDRDIDTFVTGHRKEVRAEKDPML